MAGYISLHRDIQKHWLYEEERVFSRYEAWLDILMRVNHAEGKVMHNGTIETVERGSTIWSMGDMEKHWGWSNRKVKRFLLCLESDQMAVVKSTTKKTYITVINYGKYQGDSVDKAPPMHQQSTTEAFQKHTNNNVNNDNKNNKEPINNIYAHWNSLSIIKHRKLTEKMKSVINARLVDITESEIIEAMNNYKTVLNGDIYFYSYEFTLDAFMNPKNIERFLTDNNPFKTHMRNRGGNESGEFKGRTQDIRSGSDQKENPYNFLNVSSERTGTGTELYDPDIF